MRDGVIPRRSPLTNISAPEGSDSTRSSASGTAWRRAASHPDRNWGGNSAGSGVNSGRSARTRERSASASDVFPSHRRRIPLRRKISARNGRVASVNRYDRHSASASSRSSEAAAVSTLSIRSEARDTFPAIRRNAASSGTGSSPGTVFSPEGSTGTGSHRTRSFSAMTAGIGSRSRRAERSSRSGAANFSRRAGSRVDATSSAEDEGRVTLQEAKTAARNDPEGRELLQAPLRARGDEHDPHNGPEGGLGQAHDQGTDLRADPVAALPSRDRTAGRTGRGVAQEGADALDDGLRQDVLELAGAIFQLNVVQREQVLQQHLGKTVTADDSSGASLPVLREEDLLPGGVDHAAPDELLQQAFGPGLHGGAQHLVAAGFPLFPERPEKFEDLVLALLGHFRLPFESNAFTKFTTFDSGMGKEYPQPGQQTRVHPFPMGHPERQALSVGSISRWHSGQRIFTVPPAVSKRDPRPPGEEVHRGADQQREGEDEQGHPRGHLPSVLLDDHEEIRQARDEERDGDQAHHHLEVGQHSRLRHAEEPRGAVIPPQETDQKRLRGLRRQVEHADDQRFRRDLDPDQPPQPVRGEKEKRAEEEEGDRLPQVPLDPCHRLDHEASHLAPPDGRNLEDEIRGLPGDDFRREVPDDEDDPRQQDDPGDRRDRADVRKHPEDHAKLGRAWDPEGQQQRDDHPLLARFEDPRGQCGHRVAPESEDHREHRLAVAADLLEEAIDHHREPGKVSGVLEDSESEEERPDDR